MMCMKRTYPVNVSLVLAAVFLALGAGLAIDVPDGVTIDQVRIVR